MNSDAIKTGPSRAPHRSLLKAGGLTDEQIRRPLIGIVNSFNEIVPGHVHLMQIARAVKDGVLASAERRWSLTPSVSVMVWPWGTRA